MDDRGRGRPGAPEGALLLQITRADVRDMPRADALSLVLGVLLLAAGLLSTALYGRSRRREASLLWLGSFALLYGLRLLARSTAFRLLCFEAPAAFWSYTAATLTYVIPLPGVLFLRSTIPAVRRSPPGRPPFSRPSRRAP